MFWLLNRSSTYLPHCPEFLSLLLEDAKRLENYHATKEKFLCRAKFLRMRIRARNISTGILSINHKT